MSIRARIEDAILLWENGRKHGAFLNTLVAVAGTSRRRFPDRKAVGDRDAFVRFLESAHSVRISVEYRGECLPVEQIFYKWVRCQLVHEGGLPVDIEFMPEAVPGTVSVRAGGAPEYVLRISDGWFHHMVGAVASAPQNVTEFAGGGARPEQDVKGVAFASACQVAANLSPSRLPRSCFGVPPSRVGCPEHGRCTIRPVELTVPNGGPTIEVQLYVLRLPARASGAERRRGPRRRLSPVLDATTGASCGFQPQPPGRAGRLATSMEISICLRRKSSQERSVSHSLCRSASNLSASLRIVLARLGGAYTRN